MPLLSLLICPESLEPLELMRVNDSPLLRLLVGFFDLSQLLHELEGFLLLFFELFGYVLSASSYRKIIDDKKIG